MKIARSTEIRPRQTLTMWNLAMTFMLLRLATQEGDQDVSAKGRGQAFHSFNHWQ